MSWTDRVSGRVGGAPDGLVAVGQWRWNGPGGLRVRHAVAEPSDVMVAGADGRFQCPDLGELRSDAQTVPDPDAWRSLRMIAQGIERRVCKPWADWLDEPPLMPPIDETLDETELEQEVRSKLGHLETACRLPRTLLHLEEERQLVARCQRPSSRAPMDLAARSEDWDRRTLWGIRPKRVLGMVRDELYDLYENRLVVGLIDRLDEALTQRIREVRRIVQAARSMETWQKVLESGRNYRRAKRICSLWGELWADLGLLARAGQALNRLLQLRRRVLALKDSLLYRHIGGHRRSLQLRMTNVLTHDDIYRGVAELWLAWERHALAGLEDAQARWERDQKGAAAFELFGVLLVVRSFEALQMDPDEASTETPLQPGASIRLSGPAGSVTLHWKTDNTLRVDAQGGVPPLRVVTLPAMLEASGGMGPWLDGLDTRDVLILHLAADVPRSPEALHIRLRGPGPVERPQVLVPVAPWELESVERVARALRWHLWSGMFRAYPHVVPHPPAPWLQPRQRPLWLGANAGRLVVVVPPKSGASWLDLERRIAENANEVDRLDQSLHALDPKDRRNDRDRLHLRKPRDEAERASQSDKMFREALVLAADRTEGLLRCPICAAKGTSHDFSNADGRLFRVACPACDSAWGLRDCQACDGLFPFLACPDNEPGAAPLDVDRVYGCDVLAFPLEEGVFTCTNCGKGSDGRA